MGLIVSEQIPYSGVAISQQNTPIGAILPFMGKEAPSSFLICDGGVYNIAQYPKLADFFKNQFGSSNYFGGNGTTTFSVPDLRGEFLRGSGVNSHLGQGNGDAVGSHQDGTEHIGIYGYMGDYLGIYLTGGMDKGFTVTQKIDSNVAGEAFYQQAESKVYEQADQSALFTSRPTNTSVLYIIKAKDDKLDVLDLANSANYSLDEHRVGTWIDGKPVYEKVFSGSYGEGTTDNLRTSHAISFEIENVDKLINITGSGTYTFNNKEYRVNIPFTSMTKDGQIQVTYIFSQQSNMITTQVQHLTSFNISDLNYEIIIRYTKTTD